MIGDGGFVFELEKRGYVMAGPWTPEATIENADAVKQLHREFVRAGSNILQTFTFYASDDKLKNRGNEAGTKYTCRGINDAACKIAKEVAAEGENCLVGGNICQCPTYLSGEGKEAVMNTFKEQIDVFVENGCNFMLAEYYEHVEEAEWAIEACLKFAPQLDLVASLCIGPEGDMHGVSCEDCAVRMRKAGAKCIGINCHYDPFVTLQAMQKMKNGLESAGFEINKDVFLMCQPLGYMTPDAGKQGFIDLPEFPFALEPRVCTRADMAKYARQAYDMGIRYIGFCCGVVAYHVRAVCEELAKERGMRPAGGQKWMPGFQGLSMHTKPWVRQRASDGYWATLKCASGRPDCPCTSKPANWGITQGSEGLKQQTDKTDLEQEKQKFESQGIIQK